MRNNVFFFGVSEDDGSVWVCPGAKKGNGVFANRQTETVEDAVRQFDFDGKRCLWLTCTQEIDYTSLETVLQSYIDIKDRIPKFIRLLKKLGMVKYMYVIEAHKRGGAHAHLILEFDRPLPFHNHKKNNGVLLLSDESLRENIKSAWALGHADIQVVSSNRIAGYMVKELCKNSSVERALERLKDGKPLKNDTNRVWAFYFMVIRIKGMRSWGTSRNVKRRRLDLDMNISTEGETPCIEQSEKSKEVIEKSIDRPIVLMLGREITKKEWFFPCYGKVRPGSQMEIELRRMLDEVMERKKEVIGLASLAVTVFSV